MFAERLGAAALHGAVGPWDEIVSLIPIAIGGVLLLYLYLASRRAAPDGEPDAAPGPNDPPRDGDALH